MAGITSAAIHVDEPRLTGAETISASPAIGLSIFSDSRLFREGLKALITKTQLQLVGDYDGNQPDVKRLPNPLGHLVLIHGDLGRPRLAELTRVWRGRNPAAGVLVVELRNDVELILDCIEWGAAGYTLQGDSFATVVEVINEVCHGRARCGPEVTAQLFVRLANHASAGAVGGSGATPLTPREREILGYIACNYSNRQIAEALVIELRTVKHHVHNILEKLKLQHRWDAARLAAERGWLTEQPVEG